LTPIEVAVGAAVDDPNDLRSRRAPRGQPDLEAVPPASLARERRDLAKLGGPSMKTSISDRPVRARRRPRPPEHAVGESVVDVPPALFHDRDEVMPKG